MRLEFLTALRQLRRAPGTALAAVVTLAVGIGATTAVFSFVTAVMSAASPAPDMERVVGVWSHNRNESETKGLVSPADFLDWSKRATSFDAMAAWRGTQFNVSGTTAAVRTKAMVVSRRRTCNSLAGGRCLGGRSRIRMPCAVPLESAIASHRFWQNTLNGRPDVVGQTIRLDGEPATIIAVLPPLPALGGLLLPLSLDAQQSERSSRTLFVFARLRSGMSIEAARAEMESIGSGARARISRHQPRMGGQHAAGRRRSSSARRRVWYLRCSSGLVTVVLLIGCVNVANLLLARGAARRGELAVRLALGAGGWRVVRQLLVECAVLAFLGGVLSLAVSRWTLNLLMTLGPIDSPWVANSGLNPRALLLTALAQPGGHRDCRSCAGAVGAPREPRIRLCMIPVVPEERGSRRTTQVLVAAQVAMAVALLVVAGLATRTLIALERSRRVSRWTTS